MNMKVADRIPNALYKARTQAGLSQEALAELLGISKGAVRSYESGKSTPQFDTARAWCAACGYSEDKYLSEVFQAHIVSTSVEKDREDIIRFARTAPSDQVAAVSSVTRALEEKNGKA